MSFTTENCGPVRFKEAPAVSYPRTREESQRTITDTPIMAGLPAGMSRQLRATGETKEFAAVVERAHFLMAIDSHDPPQGSAAINTVNMQSEMSQMKAHIDNLTE